MTQPSALCTAIQNEERILTGKANVTVLNSPRNSNIISLRGRSSFSIAAFKDKI